MCAACLTTEFADVARAPLQLTDIGTTMEIVFEETAIVAIAKARRGVPLSFLHASLGRRSAVFYKTEV